MPVILLPPSEGKDPGGQEPGWSPDSGRFGDDLASHRTEVAEALMAAGGGDAGLLGVKGDALERSRNANAAVLGAPTLPAWQRFTGVVWDHLDVGSLRGTPRRRARRNVLIVTALTGVNALDDPVPDHRLKLSANLAPLGKLARWWRAQVSATLNQALVGQLVVDLLPQEHRAAWQPEPDACDLRRVQLLRPDGRPAGHHAKAAKGLLARALCCSDDPERTLATWTHPQVALAVEPVGS